MKYLHFIRRKIFVQLLAEKSDETGSLLTLDGKTFHCFLNKAHVMSTLSNLHLSNLGNIYENKRSLIEAIILSLPTALIRPPYQSLPLNILA